MAGLHCHAPKNKNRNHSVNKAKILGCDISFIHKKPAFCAVFHSRVIWKSVSPRFIELCMETPCWCPSKGHQHGLCKVSETSVIGFYH